MQTKNDTPKPGDSPQQEAGEGCSGATCSALRELMLALEYLRFACEHAEGKKAVDRKMLSRAMRVGIRVGAKHKSLIEDFQRDTYWDEMWELPMKVGLPEISAERRVLLRLTGGEASTVG